MEAFSDMGVMDSVMIVLIEKGLTPGTCENYSGRGAKLFVLFKIKTHQKLR